MLSEAIDREEKSKRFRRLNNIIRNSLSETLNRNNGTILQEVIDDYEKSKLIELRSRCYNEKDIAESKTQNGEDPFDRFSRFFVLNCYTKEGLPYVGRAVRIVKRNNPLGILPTEISLMNQNELDSFSKYVNGRSNPNWSVSSLSPESKSNFEKIFQGYTNSDRVYEVGGLVGLDKSYLSCIMLILGMAQIGWVKENWDFSIQTQNPHHVGSYKKILPYKKVESDKEFYKDENGKERAGYLDHCGRPASTLYLDENGKEIRNFYYKLVSQ